MALAPQKPPRSMNKKTTSVLQENNGKNNDVKANDHTQHWSNLEEQELTRSNFVIPPPSRKYTTTDPGTLSPIYHLIYDLTAPPTVTNATTTATPTTTACPDHFTTSSEFSHHSFHPNPSDCPVSPENQQYPGASDEGQHAIDRSRQVRDGLSHLSSHSDPTVTGIHSSNYPADKRRTSNKRKDWRNRDATNTQHNKARGDGEDSFPLANRDAVDKRSDNTLPATRKEYHDNANRQHPGVWLNVSESQIISNSVATVSISDSRTTHQDQTNLNGKSTHARFKKDIGDSRLAHLAPNGHGTNSGQVDMSSSSSNNINDGTRREQYDLSESRVSVKQAIEMWSAQSQSQGNVQIIDERNSTTAYQQGENDSYSQRAVFQREGDCVRMFLVNGDNSNDKTSRKDSDACNGDIQRRKESEESKFKRDEKTNTSQRWLNKLGLLHPKGGNAKTQTKGNRKKDSKISKNSSVGDEHASLNGKEKNGGDDFKTQTNKKPLNRWDSIHVHTKQAIASATGLETQTRQTKEVSFAQAVTAPSSMGQSAVAVLTSDVTYQPDSNSTRGDLVTKSDKDKVTLKPIIKGILVNKGKGYDTNARHDATSGQFAKQNGVQFTDDTVLSFPLQFPHSSMLSPSSSFSPSLLSNQHREVIDRNKYIIKQGGLQDASSHKLNQSHDSALAFETDPLLRLDNLVGVVSPCPRGEDRSLVFDPSISNDTRNSGGKHLTNFQITGLRESGETSTTSDTSHFSSEPDCRGSRGKHGPGGLAHTPKYYNPPSEGRSEQFDHREVTNVKASGFSKCSDARSKIPYSHNYNNKGDVGHQSSEVFVDSNGDHSGRYPVFPAASQISLTSVNVCKKRRENKVEFTNQSTVNHSDAQTTTVEGDNKQVDGEDTLRYRRALRDLGQKNQNLYNVDQSSQWIRRRLEDLNSGCERKEGLAKTQPQPDVDTRGVGVHAKPQPNPKPKITPRQKFEITHNRVSGKVATNLRHNHDRIDPQLSATVSNQGDFSVSKSIANPLDLTSHFYKESPRAKFERDRAARIHSNNSIHTSIALTSDLSFNVPSSERLNKSCDDLETDSDGYLKPSTDHKSRSTETLLSSHLLYSQAPLVSISKLSPRARFENSRVHGNLKARRSVSQEPLKRDTCQPFELEDSWANSNSDLERQSVAKRIQDSVISRPTEQNGNPSVLSSHRSFPYLEEQRNRLITTKVRSVQSIGRVREEEEEETRRGGEGQYGTSVEEKFLSKQHATHLSSTANIDTNATRWSGPGGEDGIKNAGEERRAKQLNKSRAECGIHIANDAPISKPVLDTSDSHSVRVARFPEGNYKISSVNVASSDKPFVISNNFHPHGDSGGPHKDASSANCAKASHGSIGHSELPRPSQVSAVKKMSPDSVSSSGYESEHTSSANFQNISRNGESALKDKNNKNNFNWKNNNNNSLERKLAGVSTVQELRLRFGHSQLQQQQRQQQQQQQLSVDTSNIHWNNFKGPTDGRVHVSEFQNAGHVLLSDGQYDDSLIPGTPRGNTCVVSNRKAPLSSALADVNNNNNNSSRGPITQSDTGVRCKYSRDINSFSDDNDYNNNNSNRNNTVWEHGFSDSQLFSASGKRTTVNSRQDPISPTQHHSPKDKKHHKRLEKVSRSMHEIIHDLKLDSGDHQTSKRNRRSRRCSKCQDNSSPNFCPSCKHVLDRSRDSVDSEGVPPTHQSHGILLDNSSGTSVGRNCVSDSNNSVHFVPKQNRVSHSVTEVASMLASKGLRIYEDTGEYVPMKSPVKSPTLSSLTGYPFNLEAARYLIIPSIVDSITKNSSKTVDTSQDTTTDNAPRNETTRKSQRQLALDALAQRSISDSGASILRPVLSFGPDDELNNGAHSDGDICDEDEYLSMDLARTRPKAMSMDMLCSDGAIPDADDSTDVESATAPTHKVTSRLRRKDRRSSKGYVEWRTCSGWVGKTDMRLAEGRNSRGYIEWDTIWTTATPWKTEGVEDEHVYDVIQDESSSQTQDETHSQTQTPVTEDATTVATIDTPPALPERTYINRLKNTNSPDQTSGSQSPHQHHAHAHHHHHHHHHGNHHHGHHHHHHHHHSSRHQQQSHAHTGSGRRSHGHHHRSSPQLSCSNATPKLKSASKPPPPAPPVEAPPAPPSDSQNYAQVLKLKGYTFSDPLTSPTEPTSHQSGAKSVIYSENYWHIGPVTTEERLTSWQTGDVLDYIDGLHDSMSPKRRENIYILLNNKKTRAKFSESLEIESRLLSKGLLCSPGNQRDSDSKPEEMDTSTSTSSITASTNDHTSPKAAVAIAGEKGVVHKRKVRTSVSSTYV